MKRFRWEDKFDRWFDNLSYDAQIWLALSPLIGTGVILIALAVIFG